MFDKVPNERKNLTRLAGEFLVASRLTRRGYMISLQWGTTIGYDILVFDKDGHVAFLEVKTTASNRARWPLQKKYAHPERDDIQERRRFVCCVDLTPRNRDPDVWVFPCRVVAQGLHYLYDGKFSESPTYRFDLNGRPRGKSKDSSVVTMGQHIDANRYLEKYDGLGVAPVK
jgi:hypothetical protein